MPALDPKTRGICMAMATGCMDPFMSGPMTRLVAGGDHPRPGGRTRRQNFMHRHANASLSRTGGLLLGAHEDFGAARTLRRETYKDSKVVAIFADECQNFIVGRQDMMVSTMARSSKLVVVNTFQNLPLCTPAWAAAIRRGRKSRLGELPHDEDRNGEYLPNHG